MTLTAFRNLVVLTAICIFFSGCAIMEVQVTRFHRLPPAGQGQTFAIQAPRHAGQIECARYNERIAVGLTKYGWRQADPKSAQYTVVYDYGVGDPQEVTTSVPLYGQTGGGTTYHSGTVSTGGSFGSYSGTSYTAPTYGRVGTATFSGTYYTRWFNMTAYDRSKVNAFEVRAVSVGGLAEISRVLHHIIDSAFIGFPGKSGKTTTHHPIRDN